MSPPADSEVDESRTRYFTGKRSFAVAEVGSYPSGTGETPKKRNRRSRSTNQHLHDFVPMGGSFSSSHQIMDATESDAESSSSSVLSTTNSQRRRTDLVATSTQPSLGQNRLASGFSKHVSNPVTNAGEKGEDPQARRSQSVSYNDIGESIDDAIEISDDTDMEEGSDEGGVVINLADQDDDDGSHSASSEDGEITDQYPSNVRVTGWRNGEQGKIPGDAVRNLCELLARKASKGFKVPPHDVLHASQDGDAVVLSVLPEHVSTFNSLNGTVFSGMVLKLDAKSMEGEPGRKDVRHFQVTGWKESTAAATRPDGGYPALRSFLKNRAVATYGRRFRHINQNRFGDIMMWSVSPEIAHVIAELDGTRFYKAVIHVTEVTVETMTQLEWGLSDGEIDEGDEAEAEVQSKTPRAKRRKCKRCKEKGHQAGDCPDRPELQRMSSEYGQTSQDGAHNQLQGDLESSLAARPAQLANEITTVSVAQTEIRLGDLSAEDFENQVRYTLFHLNRDQIDLNRLVVCTTCLQEGHLESSCPESNCIHCGAEGEHPSRTCPTYRRCLKCRQRGHDVDTCISKLRDASIPCDLCDSNEHFENTCPTRFFPKQRSVKTGEVKLWISCCICASKTHLVGDCAERRSGAQTSVWCLQSLDANQISNLSLEAGTRKLEKDAENRGMRPQGLKIKGRADAYGRAQPLGDDVDEPFLRPPVGRKDNTSRRGGLIRFDNRGQDRDRREDDRRQDDRRQDDRDDFYRPSPYSRSQDSRYDRYDASYTDYRDQPQGRRDKYYDTDSFGGRRRSRSPEYDSHRDPRSQRAGYDSRQPPLPKEPPPNRPSQPSRQRPGVSGSLPVRPGRDAGGDTYRPMPSSAKQAWNRGR